MQRQDNKQLNKKRRVTVDRGVIPLQLSSRVSGRKKSCPDYPYQSLEVGHSFYAVCDSRDEVSKVVTSRDRYRDPGKRFLCRTVYDGGILCGVRAWRIE